MKTLIDHAAVAQPHGRLGQNRGLQFFGDGQGFGEHVLQGLQQAAAACGQREFRQYQQAVAQGGEVARAGVADGNPRGDAFDIGNVFQTGL